MDLVQLIRGAMFGGQQTVHPGTSTYSGSLRTALGDPEYFDMSMGTRLFWGANQTATAWSVALNTTYTGLVLSNPRASQSLLVPVAAGFAYSVAPAAIAPMMFFAGNSSDGITTHTTPLPMGELPTRLDSDQGTGVGNLDAAATLVGTPRWVMPFISGFTAAALPSVAPGLVDLKGLFVVPPGAYFGIGALTAVTGFGSLVWAEIPITT